MFQNEIAAGIQWLNQVRPQWFNKIKLDTFDVGKCSKCVLGQIFGEENGVEEDKYTYSAGYGYAQDHFLLTKEQLQSMGFAVDHDLANTEWRYGVLTNEWKVAILNLRSQYEVSILNDSLEGASAKQLALAT